MKLGAQMYTVHEHTQTLADLERSLEKIAKIGYTSVQVSGTCTYDPVWMCDALKRYGLKCAITHTDPKRILEETEKVLEEHKLFGCSYIGIGGMPADLRGSFEGVSKFRDAFLPAAKKLKQLGGKLFYHNHSFELERLNGKTVLEWISEFFPTNELSFTLDTYWVQAGGGDVVQWIEKLAGRLECVHLKDMAGCSDNTARMCPVYEGNMNFDAIIRACFKTGTEYLLVEQDYCYDTDPFECLKRSFVNIKSRYPSLE